MRCLGLALFLLVLCAASKQALTPPGTPQLSLAQVLLMPRLPPVPAWWLNGSSPELPPPSAYAQPSPDLLAQPSPAGDQLGGTIDDLAPLNATTNNTTASRVCSALLNNSSEENLYQHLLCPYDVVLALAKGRGASYYDLSRCSPSNYDLGCMAGFFSLDPPEASQRRQFNNAFYPTVRCCPGHYCPTGVVCMVPCSAGAYCPPVRAAHNDTFCDPYGTVATPYLGCGGAVDNHPCPAGHYCPNTTTVLLCPANYYCPSGSRNPQLCPLLAECRSGASAPKLDMGGLAKVLAVLGTLFIFVLLGRRRYKRSWERDMTAWRSQAKTAEPDDEQEAEMIQEAEEQKLLLPSRDVLHRIDVELDNIGVRLAGRWALTGVTGRLSAGRVTAIMGPSGAGKSVLLHTLAGRQVGGSAKLSGTIRLNGSDRVSLADCRTVVGFVPQEDVMHRSLTVFENVDFNAQWRLPRIMTRRQKTDVVFAALDVLGLDNPRVMRTRIGDDAERGVSGGERKRVNIGMELVAQPSLLLLDEPTSGLDASTSIDVVRALKSVAESGVNVVVALHQPRVETLRLFDDLLLLAPGGRTVYAGPTPNAVAYFTGLGYALPDHCNPADYFLDAISGLLPRNNGDGSLAAAAGSKTDHATYLVAQWEAQRAVAGARQDDRLRRQGSCSLVDLQCLDRKTAGVLAQTWLCTKRAVIQRTRELNTALTDYCLVATAGLVLGLLFHAVQLQKVPQVNLFISMALGFAATQQALRLFGAERAVFAREADTGISRLAYFLGKNLAALPDLFILPFTFLSMFYSFSSPRGAFVDYLVLLLAAQWALSGVGHVISVVLDPAKAQLAAVVVTLVLNGISGFSPHKSELGQFGAVCYASYGFWLTEALFLIEAQHYPDIYAPTKSDIAAVFDFDAARWVGVHVGVLVAMGAGCRLVCLLALELTRRAWPSPRRLWRRVASMSYHTTTST